jgi:hypothetical protein
MDRPGDPKAAHLAEELCDSGASADSTPCRCALLAPDHMWENMAAVSVQSDVPAYVQYYAEA